ncbi:MAG: hypothetical protein HY906_09830 [Deltaproteobacteria bacterium]|nr:hypothetical protein [Deltaproteobacteria bacterium]
MICVAGAKECVADRVARVCAPDGLEWVTVACLAGETCTAGECGPTAVTACTPYTGQCVNGAAAVCKADGSGYSITDCPGASVCTGAGLCQGVACVVGTRCSAQGNLRTCASASTASWPMRARR